MEINQNFTKNSYKVTSREFNQKFIGSAAIRTRYMNGFEDRLSRRSLFGSCLPICECYFACLTILLAKGIARDFPRCFLLLSEAGVHTGGEKGIRISPL